MNIKEGRNSISFIPQIDGLRFIAVFGVMLCHWASQDFSTSHILSHIPFGAGVNLFFVISGFLITYILIGEKEDILEKKTTFWKAIKNFYAKRTLRIFPIYYILIVFLCVIWYDSIKDYLINLVTYTINWYMLFKGGYLGSQTHLWSLAVEEQFYLIWPCLIFLIPKKRTLGLIVSSIIVALISKIYFIYYSPYWIGVDNATFSCFDTLGLGALIAYIQKRRIKPFKARIYKIWLLISMIIYILLLANPGCLSNEVNGLLSNFTTSVIFFFVVMIAANNGFTRLFKVFLENKVVLYLGRISYGLYLYHSYAGGIYFMNKLNHIFPNLKGDEVLFIWYFVITLVLATISWYLIERPILKLKRFFQ
jgi:peptidoglycan/LPS O-acetylase OafA/YrhL